jgi:hypothetical protein
MSKLSILCVLNLIASFANAVLGGIRSEDLVVRGFEVHAVALQVTGLVDSHDSTKPYSGPIHNVRVQARPIPVPTSIENTLVLGSPICSIEANSIEASFNVLGESVLKRDKEFACFLSNVFYLPRSNDIVLQVYDNTGSKLLQDFIATVKAKPAHFITWCLPHDQEKLQLQYDGSPWSAPIYADVSHIPQNSSIARNLLNYETPRGIGDADILESKVAGDINLTGDGQGNFIAGFQGSADGKGAERIILNALLSRMPADTAVNIRTNELAETILKLFDRDFIRQINNYIGPVKKNLGSLTSEQKQETTKAIIAYKDVYSILFNLLQQTPYGTLLSIDQVFKKLGDRR